eukprot:CAMPEP_0117482352 /NCGR_PEP_ID=MMETSP0784-20121206/13374_1 /TAXON_ID=39447 /ORGANISM="" /LENGTH=90 /DNA_ID=CAMNT_0005276843 /DNA_START=369 /DNA_END=642 /DNA_ORIENTATION=+
MDKGSIKESGSHAELMNIEIQTDSNGSMTSGWYRDLYETQHGKSDDKLEVENLRSQVAKLTGELDEAGDEKKQSVIDTIKRLKPWSARDG